MIQNITLYTSIKICSTRILKTFLNTSTKRKTTDILFFIHELKLYAYLKQVSQVQMEHQDHKEKEVSQVMLVILVQMVHQEQLDYQEKGVQLGLEGHRVHLDQQVQQANRVKRDRKEIKDYKEHQVMLLQY